jgi:hypothetical protein
MAEMKETFWPHGQRRTREFFIKPDDGDTDIGMSVWDSSAPSTAPRVVTFGGRYHNPNGPAHEAWKEDGELILQMFYINGKALSEEEFLALPATKSSSKR